MREIKFREFYKKENIMYRDIDISNECLSIHDDNVVIMQYTGLKDKNGVEIYEGDIVKTTSSELTGRWKHKVYKIEFKEINCIANAKYMGFDFQFNVDEIEVIGNIYENPELLEKIKC
jgi:uncharacterized phage protein (TIGR01671 family)